MKNIYLQTIDVRRVGSLLNAYGHRVEAVGRVGYPFDLLMDEKIRVEVKTANPIIRRGILTWQFNIHRHGVLDESKVDLYIFRFEKIPGIKKKALHALMKPPIGKSTYTVSLREIIAGKIFDSMQAFQALNKKSKKLASQKSLDN